MIPDETKEEIAEAANRGVRTLDTYEYRFKERFGVNTGVACAIDALTYATALYVFFNFPGLHIAIRLVLFIIAIVAGIGIVRKAWVITGKTMGNL